MMSEEHFEQTLLKLVQRQPFKPFRVKMLDGEEFEVDDPKYVARNGPAAAYINAAGVPFLFHNENIAQFLEITTEVVS